MTSQANRDKSRALREAAELRGDITYAGATPCPRGHWLRYTACRKCVECAKQAVKRRRSRVLVPADVLAALVAIARNEGYGSGAAVRHAEALLQ